MKQNDLTVILTLWDRVDFTYRWMRWMDQQQFPYKILIADGGLDTNIELHLRDNSNYPHLNYEYIRYPYDSSAEMYFAKLSDVLSRVTSKYAIVADNDDFILPGPLENNLDLIRQHADVHTVGPDHYRFTIHKNTKNTIDLVSSMDSAISFRRILCQANRARLQNVDPLDRLLEIVEHFHSAFIYYGIHPTASFHGIFNRFYKLGIKQFIFQEWHTLYSFGVTGKLILGASDPFLVRQDNTSQGAAGTYGTDNHATVVLSRDWSRQFYAIIDDIYDQLLEKGYDIDRRKYENDFRSAFKTDMLRWLQFRGLAERFEKRPRLYAFGQILFKLYLGFPIRKIKMGQLRKNSDLYALHGFLKEYVGR